MTFERAFIRMWSTTLLVFALLSALAKHAEPGAKDQKYTK